MSNDSNTAFEMWLANHKAREIDFKNQSLFKKITNFLYRKMRAIYPQTPVIISGGFTGNSPKGFIYKRFYNGTEYWYRNRKGKLIRPIISKLPWQK